MPQEAVQDATADQDSGTTRTLNVLVTADNPSSRQCLTALLQGAGHTVTIAEDGRLAIEAVMRHTFGIILMDTRMAVMDGIQATRHIRALPPPKHDTPIIPLDAYPTTPPSATALLAAINTLMDDDRPPILAALDHAVVRALAEFLGPGQVAALPVETLEAIGPRIDRLAACLDADDTEGAAQAAHDLVSLAGNCFARTLGRDIEHACRQGLGTKPAQAFARMPATAADTARALTAVRDSLTTDGETRQ